VTFSYIFGSQSNEWTYSMALGSVPYLVIANSCREEFEDMALELPPSLFAGFGDCYHLAS
jgi:hypothetical protein